MITRERLQMRPVAAKPEIFECRGTGIKHVNTCIVKGVRVAITGTQARYIWAKQDASAAEYRAYETIPWPDDWMIKDTQTDEQIFF